VVAEIFTNFFLSIILVPDMLESHSRALKTRILALVFQNNLSHKYGSVDWRLGTGKVGQKDPKTLPLETPPTEDPKSKPKNFFFKVNQKTCRSCRWFEHLSSSIGWEVMTEQSQSQYSGFSVLEEVLRARGWAGRKYHFSSLRYDPRESKPAYQLRWRLLNQLHQLMK